MAKNPTLLRRLRGFACNPGGGVAPLFALAAVPLLICLGAAIDYGRALIVQERMASAQDAAGLAIGSWTGLSQPELKAKAQLFFDANYKSTMATASPLQVNFNGDNIVLSVTASVPTTFMRIANIDHIDMHAKSTITKKERNIELVMVLDTTGSMASGGKITALKSAAKQMVATLFDGNDSSSTLKIGVVPFAAAVNIGFDKINSGWLDKNTYTAANAAADPIPFEDLDTAIVNGNGLSPLKLYSGNSFSSAATSLANRSWAGCVRERSGGAGAPYELTDDAPSAGTPATLWAPYFAPDEPGAASPIKGGNGGTSYSNNYLCDDSGRSWSACSGNVTYSGTCVKNATGGAGSAFSCKNSDSASANCDNVRQCRTSKYANKSVSGSANGPDYNCPPTTITAMTSTQATVNAAIDALTPKGSTVIPAGLLWGWRAISPGSPFSEGAAYNDDKFVKAIILLTDGENDVSQQGSTTGINNSSYGAFGYAKNGHLGNTNGSNANATLDAKTLTVCNAIKAKDIRLYTIGFQVSAASQTLLQSCATKPDMFYNSPTNSQLAGIFQDIAQGLSELRIAQ
jgi:Flp pilus assembly protein TadG